jgi:hypothetical protein
MLGTILNVILGIWVIQLVVGLLMYCSVRSRWPRGSSCDGPPRSCAAVKQVTGGGIDLP